MIEKPGSIITAPKAINLVSLTFYTWESGHPQQKGACEIEWQRTKKTGGPGEASHGTSYEGISVNILITETTLSTLLCGFVALPIETEHVDVPTPLRDATGLGAMSQKHPFPQR